MSAPSLHIENLHFSRGERRILEDISITVAPGEIVCLLGPNGSGKSTLLRCVAGALTPASGSIKADGRNLQSIPAAERAKIVSYCPQETPYAFAFTVREFTGLSQTSPDGTKTEDARLSFLLSHLDLIDLQHRSLLTLSGGERQRASLARALLQTAPFVLLDEPTAHLDLRHQKQLLELLRSEAQAQNRGVLLVLHDLNLAAAVAHRVYLLQAGKIVASGTAGQVITRNNIDRVYDTSVHLLHLPDDRPAIYF